MPIKFNGSIFTVDGMFQDWNLGPDYRKRGSTYWWQNARLTAMMLEYVRYLRELNGVQEASWRKTVELFSSDGGTPQQVSLFPAEHLAGEKNTQVPVIGIRRFG